MPLDPSAPAPRLFLAALTRPGVAPARDALAGLPPDLAAPLIAPLLLTLSTGPDTVIALDIGPAAATLTARAAPTVLHYYRLADATLKPLPPAPPPLTLQRGDAYIALSPGVHAVGDSPKVARFLHLRDYFNAQRLAEALLAHLLAPEAPPPQDITVFVLEAR